MINQNKKNIKLNRHTGKEIGIEVRKSHFLIGTDSKNLINILKLKIQIWRHNTEMIIILIYWIITERKHLILLIKQIILN